MAAEDDFSAARCRGFEEDGFVCQPFDEAVRCGLLGGCQASSVRKGKRTYQFALCFEYGKDFALYGRGPRAGFEVCDGFIDDVTKSFWKLFERDVGAFEAAKKAQQMIRG